MSKINDLIKKMCPNGVRFDRLENVTLLQAGDRITTAMMSDDFQYDVIGGGTLPTGKYNDYNREHCITISRAGSAGYVNWMENKFWATDVCFTAIKNNDYMNIKFIYHYLKNAQKDLQQHIYGGSMPKLEKLFLWKYPIPIPPLAVQEEIVRILDKFSELEAELDAELEAELEARKNQYEFWRDSLLKEKTSKEYKLKEVVDLYLGLTYTPNYVEEGVKFLSSLNISKGYLDLKSIKYISKDEFENSTSNAKPKKGDILYVRVGSNLGHPVIYDLEEDVCVFVSVGFARVKNTNILSNKYLKYWMDSDLFMDQVKSKTMNSPKANLNASWMKEFTIFIPSLEKQNEIVQILDKFDKLINDISIGLPAEIELRKKQYEYYRNKLLDFDGKSDE